MYDIDLLEDALYCGDTVYITDGTYTTRVVGCEAYYGIIDLFLANGKFLTLHEIDFYKRISVEWYEEDRAWIIAPDWWHSISYQY